MQLTLVKTCISQQNLVKKQYAKLEWQCYWHFKISEYDFLDTALDNIDSCLTALEQQNDDLYLQLEDLLRSNRENSQEILGQVGAEARHSVTVQEGAAAEVAVKPSTSESSDSKNPSEATESQTTQNLKPETSKSPDQPSEWFELITHETFYLI